MADVTRHDDEKLFTKDVTFEGDVSFNGEGESPSFSLDNLTNLTGSGTCTFADLVSTDDVTVGDDLVVTGAVTIGETLAVTGHYTSAAGNITLTAGTVSAEQLTSTDDLTVAGAATIGELVTITTGGLTLSAGTLTITGISVVGLHEYLTLQIPNLVGSDAKVYGINCPVAGTITRIASRLGGAALTTGDATITAKIAAVAVTNGVVTITQSGSAEGDLDAATPTAANTVAVGSNLNFTVGGTNDATAAFATLTITIRRTA